MGKHLSEEQRYRIYALQGFGLSQAAIAAAVGSNQSVVSREMKRTRDALLAHPGIKEVFDKASRLDMAILSVGDLSPFSTISEYCLLEREELASLQAAGAVGDVLCRFIDARGNVINHPINERVVAVDPQELRGARNIVLASGGWQKFEVIRAAMKFPKPHVLVTDELVAERLAALGADFK